MENYININNLSVSEILFNFIEREAIPDTGISSKLFWINFDKFVHELTPVNKALLEERRKIQLEIDRWHLKNKFKKINTKEYKKFLEKIGYIKKVGPSFKIKTQNLDEEISSIAGPQLVVPISNSRYALNAANARYQSLYDSLYGTDVIQSEDSASERYDPERGLEVIKFTKKFLDSHFELTKGKWINVENIYINNKNLIFVSKNKLLKLKNENKFIGFRGEKKNPSAIILKNNHLHVEIIINPNAFSAKSDPAGISDIIVESAITTICDHEDSVAAVDAKDKVIGYRNWLGLMKGNLKTTFEKKGKNFVRKLNPDRKYTTKFGKESKLHGRALLLNRNNGHLMTSPSILLKDGSEIPEGILDCFVTTLCSLHDLKKRKNSRKGSVMIVKPKQHGPEECAFTDLMFSKVEKTFNLKKNTIKCGIMDEERRTSINLKECIRNLKDRVFFINTGFLDRTGDEIHTSMEIGVMVKKGDMKLSKWIKAYEKNNVNVGLECGFSGVAQIGKGMYAEPDNMSKMLKEKISHLEAGANCAWVPSPTAAALHALHYHEINIFKKHNEIRKNTNNYIDDILTIPFVNNPKWKDIDIRNEIANCSQSILGYVVRWIDQGIGCSKVPDINGVNLMEDRATLRISSQLLANWLHHGVCSRKQVLEIMKKMASVVDKQNIYDKKYEKMSPSFDKSIAFKTACELIFQGKDQPSGYTEPLLHLNRLIKKS
ncbi:MAG: malate synthase G [Rickettsiales bacterium TMED289]|nr:MAG: malate synthase G [Rickettsiales bacterium TMED289]|tara:strand:+ start:2043 stop:4190 length:2148 start_codon:yes stop_codon:yes gene_type:complete